MTQTFFESIITLYASVAVFNEDCPLLSHTWYGILVPGTIYRTVYCGTLKSGFL